MGTRDDFETQIARWQKRAALRLELVQKALAVSPAIVLSDRSHESRPPMRQLVIVSYDTYPNPAGPIRISEFGVDGPYGHHNAKTMTAAAEEISRMPWKKIAVAYDPDVIAWTSTPEFARGIKVAALIQADNTLRYEVGKRHGYGNDYDEAAALTRRAHAMFEDDPDGAVKMLEDRIKALALNDNPAMKKNPDWVTTSIAINYDLLEKKVPPAWLPHLDNVRPGPRGTVQAEIHELGCGGYGCVLPTLDEKMVLKVTTDTTEAEFASQLASDLVAPVCVRYHLVIRLAARFRGEPIHLLWRDAADRVGKLEEDLGRAMKDVVNEQHRLAQLAYDALFRKKPIHQTSEAVNAWADYLDRLSRDKATKKPIADLFAGMHKVFMQQKILFGDVHSGNVAKVGDRWVIIDPGNIAVVD